MKKKRISELITIDHIKKWKYGDTITIKAGTGSGKSYFIKNILYAFAKSKGKKILMLIHRTNCVSQFKEEIIRGGKTDVIDIKTYQSLERAKVNSNEDFDFSEYSYVVCDEFHYFMGDASFNKTTDMSFDMILNQTSVVKIFMSATGDYMKKYINENKAIKTTNYEVDITFDYIKELMFFNKDESMENFIDEIIVKKTKAIFFVQSAKKAYELHLKYKKDTLFNCSKTNLEYYKYVDEDKIENMLRNEKFDERVLITTTCLDAGVNIIDDEVKHVVCDVRETGSLVQCIGRKRFKNGREKIHLYIKTIHNKKLGGAKSQIQKKIEMADYHREHGTKLFVEKYARENDYSNIVYDATVKDDDKCTKKVNELMYFKSINDIEEINDMLGQGEYGYCKSIANVLGFKDKENGYNYKVLEEECKIGTLEDYLEGIVGNKLLKEEQKELVDKINLRVDGRQQKSYSKLNEGLRMLKLQYMIIPKRSSDIRYWVVEKFEL